MASFPGLCKPVGPAEEENGELDGSLQQMLKAIADERNRLNSRQEISGLGESDPQWTWRYLWELMAACLPLYIRFILIYFWNRTTSQSPRQPSNRFICATICCSIYLCPALFPTFCASDCMQGRTNGSKRLQLWAPFCFKIEDILLLSLSVDIVQQSDRQTKGKIYYWSIQNKIL